MKVKKSSDKKRWTVLREFAMFGFKGQTSFYNVCKSIDTTLDDFELADFWQGEKVSSLLISKLECILQRLRYE